MLVCGLKCPHFAPGPSSHPRALWLARRSGESRLRETNTLVLAQGECVSEDTDGLEHALSVPLKRAMGDSSTVMIQVGVLEVVSTDRTADGAAFTANVAYRSANSSWKYPVPGPARESAGPHRDATLSCLS